MRGALRLTYYPNYRTMDNMTNLLTNCLYKQKPELKRIFESAFVPRELTSQLQRSLDDDAIKVIIGPRRSGKSSLAIQALEGKNFAYFNFEDESLTFDFSSDQLLESFTQVYPGFEYILFDEIQLFPKWEHLVNRLHRLGHKILITGSNSKMLSGELASSLTGRYIEYQLLTFSYGEYLRAGSIGQSLDSFMAYLHMGGFPSVVTKRIHPKDFLPDLWDAIVLKDLVQRFKIRRPAELKNLLYLVLTNISSKVSARSLSRNINGQLTHSTINKYLAWAEGAYLCSMVHQYSFKARQRVNSDKKIYLYDTGFYDAHRHSAARDLGKILENYVFVELCRQGLVPNLSLFGYQTKSQYEVDFYIPPITGEAKLVQVCFSTSDIETRQREIRALISAAKELNVKKLYILSCDESEQRFVQDGFEIDVLPAWRIDLCSGLISAS